VNFELVKNGIFLGLILSVLIGPVFFVLLETSIRRGARDAVLIDIGVLLADVLYLLLLISVLNKLSFGLRSMSFSNLLEQESLSLTDSIR